MVFYAIFKRALGLFLSLIVIFSLAYSDTIDNFHLLKISPQDERAVVKMEDGSMKIIRPGDAIIGIVNQTGQYAWALQEKLKGRHDTNLLLGSNYGGWGFNLIDYNRYLPNGTYVPIYPSDAENIQRPELLTKPFFKKGSNDALYTEDGGSNYALENRIKLLAEAFPARTLAAGKEKVIGIPVSNNFDMQANFKTKKNGAQFWPVAREDRPNWRHNDIKTVAYSYIFEIFNEFLKQGGLK